MKTTTTKSVARLFAGWVRGLGLALIRAGAHLATPPSGWWLLKDMTDDDLLNLIEMCPEQRRYSLERRRWQSAIGHPVKKQARSVGRAR